MDNVLVIQMARMGDFIQSTPLLCGIKKANPGCTLHMLVDKNILDFAGTCPFVDQRYGLDTQLLTSAVSRRDNAKTVYGLVREQCRELHELAVDAVYNLNYSPITALLSSIPHADYVLGYGISENRNRLSRTPWFAFFNTMIRHMPLAPFNLVDFFYYLGGLPEHRPQQPCYRPTRESVDEATKLLIDNGIAGTRDILIALQLGTRHMQRQWPVESFVQTACAMLEHPDMRLLLLGAENDKLHGEAFMHMTAGWERHKQERILNLIGATTLSQLAGLLMRSRLLLSADTGTMHLAAAVGTSVVALFFGPAYAHFTGPYGPEHWILQAQNHCSPCIEDRPSCADFHCRYTIQPQHVQAVMEHLLFRTTLNISDTDSIAILRSRFDRWGIVYDSFTEQQQKANTFQSYCYREMGKTILDARYEPDGDIYKRLLDICGKMDKLYYKRRLLLQQSQILEQQMHAHREGPLGYRFDDQYSFWHPWIDFYDEMLRHDDDIPQKSDRAQSFFTSGLYTANKIFNSLNMQ